MSHEYFGTVAPDVALPLQEILDASALPPHLDLVAASPSQWRLRWRDRPRQPDWPVDFTISRQPEGLWVAFHAGYSSERRAFLDWLTERLQARAQVRIAFEED